MQSLKGYENQGVKAKGHEVYVDISLLEED